MSKSATVVPPVSSTQVVGEALRSGRHELLALDQPDGASTRDAEILLAAVLEQARSYLYAHADQTVTTAQATKFHALIERRAAGEPVAYLLGRREFWSMDLLVTADTLIPRPETELLVELALQKIPADAAGRIADLGTGSGAIALALARERPRCQVLATDLSKAALAVARANAERLGIANVTFHHGVWCAALTGPQCDLIVSNPPYISAADPHLSDGDVRFEPQAALTPGPDGLAALRVIASEALHHLNPNGCLLMEHGYDQAVAVTALLRELGYRDITDHADLGGQPRVVQARL
ncbi:MAG: peptide chain release factor N(5)-glutamine methyltransferase [Gammaproteobacteria bacterium]